MTTPKEVDIMASTHTLLTISQIQLIIFERFGKCQFATH